MISYLIGTIHHVFDESFIILAQGVGYEVFATGSMLQKLRSGDEAEVYVHHHIREDNQSLYGFASMDEREMFQKLISVSGIGPKSALAALGAAPLGELIMAIQSEDHSVFQSVPGIGPKTAKRVVLELKSKVEGVALSPVGDEDTMASSNRSDVLAALEQLGYSSSEILPYIREMDLSKVSIEEAIKDILKWIK